MAFSVACLDLKLAYNLSVFSGQLGMAYVFRVRSLSDIEVLYREIKETVLVSIKAIIRKRLYRRSYIRYGACFRNAVFYHRFAHSENRSLYRFERSFSCLRQTSHSPHKALYRKIQTEI